MSEAVNKTKSSRKHLKLVALIAAVYVAWVAATYVLEGRINLLSRFDPVGRVLYVAIANIAIGIFFSTWVLRDGLKNRIIQPKQLGLQESKARTATIIGIAVVAGAALFLSQNPRSTDPMIVFNVFMQVLPVSIAEVLVCWSLIGTGVESITKHKGRVLSVVIGAIAASVLFGVYHFAHSPPFNEVNMVLFLMLPSIATAIAYFVGRDVYAAIIVQNFLGIVGVLGGTP
ncbi:MAG: hypothetical protein MN733_12685, partial [Nitrososphaera sp.]|nr:hypothetical protein [Nitrososphaera sp.]